MRLVPGALLFPEFVQTGWDEVVLPEVARATQLFVVLSLFPEYVSGDVDVGGEEGAVGGAATMRFGDMQLGFLCLVLGWGLAFHGKYMYNGFNRIGISFIRVGHAGLIVIMNNMMMSSLINVTAKNMGYSFVLSI